MLLSILGLNGPKPLPPERRWSRSGLGGKFLKVDTAKADEVGNLSGRHALFASR